MYACFSFNLFCEHSLWNVVEMKTRSDVSVPLTSSPFLATFLNYLKSHFKLAFKVLFLFIQRGRKRGPRASSKTALSLYVYDNVCCSLCYRAVWGEAERFLECSFFIQFLSQKKYRNIAVFLWLYLLLRYPQPSQCSHPKWKSYVTRFSVAWSATYIFDCHKLRKQFSLVEFHI